MEKETEKKSANEAEMLDGKRVSKTWLAALKSKGSVWVTYPKFVKLTKECLGK